MAPCNCIDVTANGLHVSAIHLSIKCVPYVTGRWKVLRNGTLFVRSGVVTVTGGDGWTWQKGWTFADGDQLCGGFWTTTGQWFNAPDGPACVGVHS